MGDPCGIGAEVIAKALARPEVAEWCTPLVVGNVDIMRRAVELTGTQLPSSLWSRRMRQP